LSGVGVTQPEAVFDSGKAQEFLGAEDRVVERVSFLFN
jgi:hypothetical protein